MEDTGLVDDILTNKWCTLEVCEAFERFFKPLRGKTVCKFEEHWETGLFMIEFHL